MFYVFWAADVYVVELCSVPPLQPLSIAFSIQKSLVLDSYVFWILNLLDWQFAEETALQSVP